MCRVPSRSAANILSIPTAIAANVPSQPIAARLDSALQCVLQDPATPSHRMHGPHVDTELRGASSATHSPEQVWENRPLLASGVTNEAGTKDAWTSAALKPSTTAFAARAREHEAKCRKLTVYHRSAYTLAGLGAAVAGFRVSVDAMQNVVAMTLRAVWLRDGHRSYASVVAPGCSVATPRGLQVVGRDRERPTTNPQTR